MKKWMIVMALALVMAAAFASQTMAACGTGGVPCPTDTMPKP